MTPAPRFPDDDERNRPAVFPAAALRFPARFLLRLIDRAVQGTFEEWLSIQKLQEKKHQPININQPISQSTNNKLSQKPNNQKPQQKKQRLCGSSEDQELGMEQFGPQPKAEDRKHHDRPGSKWLQHRW